MFSYVTPDNPSSNVELHRPVSSREWNTTLLPNNVWSGASSHLALKQHTSSLQQHLVGGLSHEERRSSSSCRLGLTDACL